VDDVWTIEALPWDLTALKAAGYVVIVSFECDRLDPGEIRAAQSRPDFLGTWSRMFLCSHSC
jgi:hypothetical protein